MYMNRWTAKTRLYKIAEDPYLFELMIGLTIPCEYDRLYRFNLLLNHVQ